MQHDTISLKYSRLHLVETLKRCIDKLAMRARRSGSAICRYWWRHFVSLRYHKQILVESRRDVWLIQVYNKADVVGDSTSTANGWVPEFEFWFSQEASDHN